MAIRNRVGRKAGRKTVRSHRAARAAYRRARTRAEHRMLEAARARGLAGLTPHASAVGA
jgi:hypothetical protein